MSAVDRNLRETRGTEPARCPAHGKTAIEHIDEYANDCAAPPYELDDEGGCGGCETYAATGMHWDTCPQRGRNAVQVAPRDLASHWRREAERLKVENDKLQSERLSARQASASDPEIMALARIVAELQRLDETERGRTLRYLNHRYADSGATVVRRGGLVMNTTGGAPLA